MRCSLARAAPAALASVTSTSSAPATALRQTTQQQMLLPARRVARKIAAVGRNQRQQQERRQPLPQPLQASTTNFRFPKLSMPGIDGAMSSFTSDIDAAESDGTLIDVTVRDVKVRNVFFLEEVESRTRGDRLQKSTFRDAFEKLLRLLFSRSRSRWMRRAKKCFLIAPSERQNEQQRSKKPENRLKCAPKRASGSFSALPRLLTSQFYRYWMCWIHKRL